MQICLCQLTIRYNNMKNYIGISRDHSLSMSHLARAAAVDYNNTVESVKRNAIAQNQDTIVSVVKSGVGYSGAIVKEITNSSVQSLKPLVESAYITDGHYTPLFDSVGTLIEMLESAPDAKDPNVSFLIFAVTDGEDNSSYKYKNISSVIHRLQETGRWTFVFRVPKPTYSLNYKRDLIDLGVPANNIFEWDQSEAGVRAATVATDSAIERFYQGRAKGEASTKNFFTTDLSKVSVSTVKAKLVNITKDVTFMDVNSRDDGSQIRSFVEAKLKRPMKKGAAFYQLTKTESKVQDHKQIAIRDKKTKVVYSGVQARNLLNLPHNGTVKVVPGNHGAYDIFIQSTSVNRKLVEGTQVMYWDNVGVAYQS